MQAGLADITQSLKNYRPSVTVLEAQMAPSRRGEGAGGTGAPGLTAANGPDDGLVAIMEQRNAHESAIKVGTRQIAGFQPRFLSSLDGSLFVPHMSSVQQFQARICRMFTV